MKLSPLTIKIISISLMLLEVVLIIIAFESHSVLGIIALLLFNLVFALVFTFKNWFWIRTIVDYMLGRATGYTFKDGKAMFPKNGKVKK